MRLLRAFILGAAAGFSVPAPVLATETPAVRTDICARYDKCRLLTPGEKRLARSFYGNAIDYSNVHVIKGRYLNLFPIGNYSGIAPDGNIYAVARDIQSDDYSKEPEKAHFFLHELDHVRQRQEGLPVIVRALSTHFMAFRDPYRYKLEPGKAFRAYNFEQQAKIVEHSYILGEFLRSRGTRYAEVKDHLSFANACKKWERLSETLKGVVRTGAKPRLCR